MYAEYTTKLSIMKNPCFSAVSSLVGPFQAYTEFKSTTSTKLHKYDRLQSTKCNGKEMNFQMLSTSEKC